MKKRIFGNRSRTKHVLAILLAVSMTVQQGGFVPASEGEVSIASEQPADAEAQARAQAEAEAKAQAEAEARAQAEAEAKAKAESEAKAKEEAEAKARAESEAKAKEEAEARARAESEAKAKAESEAKAKAESEAKAKAESEAKAKAESEAKAKAESEAKAKAEAESRTESDAASGESSKSTEAQSKETAPLAETENQNLPSETVPEAQNTETEKESELSSESTESNLQTETGSESESEQQTELLSETESESESESESETEKETEATKRVYQYSDARVSVTATLAKASQVPDDAQFIVNKTGETDDTLYYDIYFNAPRKDENGNVTGWGEYEPESGSVSVSFRFNQNQLSEDLGAEQASDVTVVHVLDSGAQETLAANVSLSGSTDRVSFTTQSFSTYCFIVNGKIIEYKNGDTTYYQNPETTWNVNSGTTDYSTIKDIADQLGIIVDYSVYTNHLKSNSHIEGNIAAGIYETVGGSGNLNQDTRIIRGAELKELKVVKQLEGGTDSTFYFNLTDKHGNVVVSFSIATNGGYGELDLMKNPALKDTISSALQDGPLYLHELTGPNGAVVENGGNFEKDGYRYEVSYVTGDGKTQENYNQIASTTLNNMIGSFKVKEDTDLTVMEYFGPAGTLTYVDPEQVTSAVWDGNDLLITMKDGKKVRLLNARREGLNPEDYIINRQGLTNEISSNLDSAKAFSALLANAKSGPAEGNASKNAGAVNIINLISKTGELRKDLVNAGFAINENGEGDWIKGLLENTGYEIGADESGDQYLVINIDCTGISEYTLGKLMIDGYHPDSNNQFSKLSSHVIFNFVQKNANGEFEAYTGTITNGSVTGGTILAPGAKVNQSGAGGLFGAIIADEVDRTNTGAEVHKKTIYSTSRAVDATVQNTTNSTEVQLKVKKEMVPRPPRAGEFSFTIAAQGNAPLPGSGTTARNDAEGWVTFGKIKYASDGTYSYTITENKDSRSYIQFDSNVITATVQVSNGKATVSYSGGSGSGNTFKNHYSASGTVTFSGTKTIDTRELKEGETFSFEITETFNGTPKDPYIVTSIGQDIEFGPITYQYANDGRTIDDRGIHVYTIRESSQDEKGITVDRRVYIVTVEVSDNGDGTLNVVKSGDDPSNLNFVNHYDATGTATLEGTKQIEGRSFTTDDHLTVKVEGDDPLPDPATITVPLEAGQTNAPFSFSPINYSLADLKGADSRVFSYLITETASMKGTTPDAAIKSALVTVTDQKDGTLSTSVQYYDQGKAANNNKLVFRNQYHTEAKFKPEGTKIIENRKFKAGDTMEVTISSDDSTAPLPSPAKITLSPTAGTQSCDFSFNDIQYDANLLGDANKKTFTYNVTETINDMDGTVEYPAGKAHTITVVLEKDEFGDLLVTPTYSDGNKVILRNQYSAAGSITFEGYKSIEGRDITDSDSFTFEIREGNKTIGQEVSLTGDIVTSGDSSRRKINYPTINYYKKTENNRTVDDTGLHTYTIRETSADENGIKKDTRVYTVKVQVTDNQNGTLTATRIDSGPAQLDFVNTYEAKGTATFAGRKTLEGRELKNTDVFTFEVLEVNSATATEGTLIAECRNNADGTINYPVIAYVKNKDKDDTRTHYYYVKETSQDEAGITVSTQSYHVTVDVSDHGDGTLDIVKSENADKLDFINTYSAEGSGEIKVQKILEGRDWTDEDAFTFTISPDSANPDEAAVPGERSVTVTKADADQIKSFGAITFKKPGTYKYTVKEAKGEIGGITYDGTEHVVTIKVKDDEKGHLIADDCETVQTVQFTNTYSEEGRGEIKVQKVLEGREWTDADAFTFTIAAGAQNPDAAAVPAVNTVTVTKADADQTKSFGEIVFTKPGTYTYTVKETKGSLGGVTYDETEHTVTLTVESIGDGKLGAAQGDTLVKTETFTNTYAAAGTGEIRVKKNFMSPQWTADHRFEFTLEAGANTAGDGVVTPMPEGNEHKAVITKDTRDYTASFGTIAFTKPGSYTYTVKETVPADTKGIVYDAQAGAGKTVTIKVKDNGDGTLVAEADSALVQTAEFTNTETGNGSIEVTKYTLKANGAFKVVNQTYYTALFSDAALTQRISEVKALVLRNTYTNSVTFTNLPYGTYYVGETNASGTPVTSGPNILSVVIEGGTITLSDANRTGSAVIKNTVPEGVLGAYADVSLKVQKNVVDASGRPLKVTDTFYFAVYTDAACTQRVRGVGVQSVKLSGSSGGSTSFRNLPYAATFYIAEVDKNGNKVASKTSFDYSVTVNGDGLTYRGAENATVTVTNKLKKGRVAAENRDTQEVKGAVRTGDNTPVLPMLATMIASGLAALYLVLYRRKRRS